MRVLLATLLACILLGQTIASAQVMQADPSLVKRPAAASSAGKAPLGQVPLKGTVSESLYLPPAMYGQWTVAGTLMDTNVPEHSKQTTQDIWTLERVGDKVVVSNPATGATAEVQVEAVQDNTATFQRVVLADSRRFFTETVTVTVNGQTMSGTTYKQFKYLNRDGRLSRQLYARFHLEAERISGPTARMHHSSEPDFEIQEVFPARR